MNILRLLFFIIISLHISLAQNFTQSPYVSAEKGIILEKTITDVKVVGFIAHIKIEQTYIITESKKDIHYVFPASNKSSIEEISISQYDYLLSAEVKSKEKNRSLYQQASHKNVKEIFKSDRKKAIHLTAKSLKKGSLKTTVIYTETLNYSGGSYFLNIPKIEQPHLRAQKPKYSKSKITVDLNSPISFKKIESHSHQLEKKKETPTKYKISFLEETNPSLKYYNLKYKLTADKIESGVITTKYENENYFLAMINPPQKQYVKPTPKEYIFLIDISGSMEGLGYTIAQKIINRTLAKLKPQDLFNIVYFASKSNLLFSKSQPATLENKKKAQVHFQSKYAYGGTNLFDAMEFAMATPKIPGMARHFTTITDGQLWIKPQDIRFLKKSTGRANFFTIGVGKLVNKKIIKSLNYISHSKPFIMESESAANKLIERYLDYTLQTVATDISFNFKNVHTFGLESQLGDLLIDRPLFVLGKYKSAHFPEFRVNLNKNKQKIRLKSKFPQKAIATHLAKKAWANEKTNRLAIEQLQSHENKPVIEQLGKQNHIKTAYTELVATEEENEKKRAYTLIKNKGTVIQEIKEDFSFVNHKLKGIYFDFGESKIKEPYLSVLDQAIYVLNLYPNIQFEIQGHTDCVGKSAENIILSKQRAEAIMYYLTKKGVNSEQLKIKAFGENQPIQKCGDCTNCDAKIKAKNRRIEFKAIIKNE